MHPDKATKSRKGVSEGCRSRAHLINYNGRKAAETGSCKCTSALNGHIVHIYLFLAMSAAIYNRHKKP
eukprot:scaffold15328_cov16-Prasinocladus_malaysianus.AAC.2